MAWRLLVCACALLASGCFRWAPVSSLSNIDDDRVRVQEEWGSRELIHATANGRVIEAQTVYGNPVEVDATRAKVLVRRLNVPATAAIITISSLAVAGTITALALFIAILTQPVFAGASK
jgi:hypothetical protein